MEEEGIRPIEMTLKEVAETDKDTKDGQTKTNKLTFKGNMGKVEVGFTMKTETRDLLEDIIELKLGTPLFLKIVPDPQTTLDEIVKDNVDKKKRPRKPKKDDIIKQEPTIIDAEHKLVGPKELVAGDDGNVLDELKG